MTQTLTTERQQFEQWWHEEYCHLEGSSEAAFVKHVAWEAMKKARELLATREAQPVAHVSEESFSSDGTSDIMTKNLPIGTALFTEQPVSVVPEEAYSDDCPDLYPSQPDAWAAGYNACRAAMLAQPVSQGYKLVPINPTPKQWAAGLMAIDTEMDKVTLVYKAMLAAAPEGGNDA